MSLKKITYQNSVILDDIQWFWSENYNALYKRNLSSGKIQRVSGYESYKNAAYTKLVLYKNKLIALPYAASQIMIYDMLQDQFRYISTGIPEMTKENSNSEKFFGFVTKGNWLFMIGCKTGHLLKFDMEQELTAGHVNLYAGKKEKGIGFLREGIIVEELLMVPALYDNFVFMVDINNLHYEKRAFVKSGTGFSTICEADKQIWIFPFDEGEIIQWNYNDGNTKKHEISGFLDFRKACRNFLSTERIGSKIWIIPRTGNRILSYDLDTNQFSNQNAVNTYFDNSEKRLIGIAEEVLGEKLLILTEQNDELILFDTEKDEIRLIDNEMSDIDYLDYLKNKKEKIVVFEKDIRLVNYLRFIYR